MGEKRLAGSNNKLLWDEIYDVIMADSSDVEPDSRFGSHRCV